MAVLAVIAYHAGLAPAGNRGVDLFFVLSGFLITSLLIQEFGNGGRIDLMRFYWRRFLRLYPALLVVLVAVLASAPLLPRSAPPSAFGIASILFYFSNWHYEMSGLPNELGVMPHTWSLAVEEQFYLVWPTVMVVVLLWRHPARNLLLVALLLGGLSVAAGLTAGPGDSLGLRNNGTDVQVQQLMWGCAAAILLAGARDQGRVGRLLGYAAAPAVLAMVVVVLPWWYPVPHGPYILLGAAFGMASALVIGRLFYAGQASLLGRVLSLAPLVYLGRISYGLYLWHYPVFALIRINSDLAWPVWLALSFGTTLSLASASHLLVERPLLRRRDGVRFLRSTPPKSDLARVTAPVESG